MDEKMLQQIADDAKFVRDELPGLRALPAEVEATKAKLGDTLAKVEATAAQVDALAKDMTESRKLLETRLGKSGADDWEKFLGDTIRATYMRKRYGHIPENRNITKAAADYVTTTDASAGVFVPTILDPQVREILQINGQLWNKVQKFTLPPGKAIDMPWENTLATASVRVAQGGALTQDAGPIAFGKDTLRTALVNDFVIFATELLDSADINVGTVFAQQMIRQIVRKMEYGLILGTTSGSAWPHMGIINATSVNSQTTMATVTMALVNTFIGECIADYEGAYDQASNCFVTTPAVAHQMSGLTVGTSAASWYTWGDPVNGRPPRVFGYELVVTPHAISTTNRAILSPLSQIKVAWSGGFTIDFNPWASGIAAAGDGWASNETAMKVFTYYDYGLGNPDQHHFAVFTALA